MAMPNLPVYPVAISENITAVNWGGRIFSVVDADNNHHNGEIAWIGNNLPEERELMEYVVPTTAGLNANRACLILTPARLYWGCTPGAMQEYHFTNVAGQPMRAYELQPEDWFGITMDGVDAITPWNPETKTGGVQVGNYLVAQNSSGRMLEVAAIPADVAFVAQVADIDTSPIRPYITPINVPYTPFVGVRVLRNQVA